jgi:hypothetical protein
MITNADAQATVYQLGGFAKRGSRARIIFDER